MSSHSTPGTRPKSRPGFPFPAPLEERGERRSKRLDRRPFFGEGPLRKALSELEAHYHAERNHQGLENQLIDPGGEVGQTTGTIECRERLGGLLRYYHRRAA